MYTFNNDVTLISKCDYLKACGPGQKCENNACVSCMDPQFNIGIPNHSDAMCQDCTCDNCKCVT